jgi:ApbE superfamily uncharacterized protein (UPF0280 family)
MPLLKTKRSGSFELQVQDLTLRITAPEEYSEECRAAALSAWEQLHAYSLRHPEFRSSKVPVDVPDNAPAIVREMAAVAKMAGVGPAFTTQGAVCEHVGRFLSNIVPEVVVSTGGDYYIRSKKRMKLALYQGPSAGGLSVVVDPKRGTQGVFTSVGRIRLPAQSVDGLAVLASTTIMADAASAAVMAILSRPNSFRKALTFLDSLDGVQGAVVVQGKRIGVAGAIELAA